jgi:hypothetical protein
MGLMGLMQALVKSPRIVQASLSTRRRPERWMDHPWITLAVSQAYLTASVSLSLLQEYILSCLRPLVQSLLQGLQVVFVAVHKSAFRRTQ